MTHDQKLELIKRLKSGEKPWDIGVYLSRFD